MKSLMDSLVNGPKKDAVDGVEPDPSLDLEDALVNAIDLSLIGDNGFRHKQSDSFAPSSTNTCARYAVYRMRGYEQEVSFNPQTLRIFDMGKRVEDAVGELLDGIGILRESQVEVKLDDPPIRGYVDFIVDWDGLKPIECKSINEAGMMYRRNYHKPKDEHFRQLQFYLHILNMESGFLLYYCKNDSSLLPLLVERDDVFIEKTLAKYRKTHKAFKDGILPIRPYKSTSEKCNRCDAKAHCFADIEVGVKL